MKFATLIRRLQLVASGGISRVIVSLHSVIASFVIVRWQSSTLWGEAVAYILLLDFAFSIIAWGATPYLIREFSFRPHQQKFSWAQSVSARSLLLLPFLVFILLSAFSFEQKLILVIWCLARFVYHAFESIIQFEHRYKLSLIAELGGLAILLIPIFWTHDRLSIEKLLWLLALSMTFRAAVCLILLRPHLALTVPHKKYFISAFPFLLLTFSAMLQQRSDLFAVAYFLTKPEVAKYQVFLSLLIFSQFLASVLLSPFAKNIFRLSQKSTLKLERRFLLSGIPLSAICLFGIFILMKYFYQLDISLLLYAMGFIYVLAFYGYLIKNYELGKANRQLTASAFSLVASVVSAVLCVWLTPKFHLEGALLAGLGGQVTLLLLYHYPASYAAR